MLVLVCHNIMSKILPSVIERGVVLFFSWCGVPLLEGGAVPSRVPHHHSRLAVDPGLQELELGFGHYLHSSQACHCVYKM
jgi:hypothetical protein